LDDLHQRVAISAAAFCLSYGWRLSPDRAIINDSPGRSSSPAREHLPSA
jgi:hypothetical protein